MLSTVLLKCGSSCVIFISFSSVSNIVIVKSNGFGICIVVTNKFISLLFSLALSSSNLILFKKYGTSPVLPPNKTTYPFSNIDLISSTLVSKSPKLY